MDLAGKRFAVIGGAGFIGSHVTDQLLAAGAREVVVLDDLRRGRQGNLAKAAQDPRLRFVRGSITDLKEVRAVVNGVDGVFLLAALWLDECARNPRAAWEVNVLGTWNVVESCRDAGRPRIVFSSSASVYGDAISIPMTEDHPLGNRTVYGATKIAGEQMLRSAAAGWHQPFVGLRYMNVYGPRMDDRGAYVGVVVRMLEQLQRGKRPIIHGDGNQTFDFVHAVDVARANLLAMASTFSDEFINIGSGHGTRIADLAQMLTELAGSIVEPIYEAEGQAFVTRRVASTEKALAILGFQTEVGLAEGLADFYQVWASPQLSSHRTAKGRER